MITVSNTYTLSYLAKHELTKEIIHKYLKLLVFDEHQLENMDATLQELYTYNMGGGIPHDVITALMAELDRLPVPLEQNPKLELAEEIETRINALTRKDWQEIDRLYKRVKNHKGSFYKVGGKRLSKHVVEMPYAIESPVVKDVRKFFYDKNLIIPFNWGSWDEGRAMFQKQGKDKLNDLIISEVIKLFTAIIRNDRFVTGAWAELFERGDAAKLLKRMLYFKDERYPNAADLAIENLRLAKFDPATTATPEEIEEAERAILDNPDAVLGKSNGKGYPQGKKP